MRINVECEVLWIEIKIDTVEKLASLHFKMPMTIKYASIAKSAGWSFRIGMRWVDLDDARCDGSSPTIQIRCRGLGTGTTGPVGK
jgi:hypothetical protein